MGQHQIRRTLDVSERASYLEVIAHEQGACKAIEVFRKLSLQSLWRICWVRTRRKTFHVTLEGHTEPVTSVVVGECENGRRVIVSGSADCTIRLWDLETGTSLGQPLKGHTAPVTSVAVGECKNGRRVIVSGSDDCTVRLWDMETGASVGEPLEGHMSNVRAVAVGVRKSGCRVIDSLRELGSHSANMGSGDRGTNRQAP